MVSGVLALPTHYDFMAIVTVERNKVSIERWKMSPTMMITCLWPHTRDPWDEYPDVRRFSFPSHPTSAYLIAIACQPWWNVTTVRNVQRRFGASHISSDRAPINTTCSHVSTLWPISGREDFYPKLTKRFSGQCRAIFLPFQAGFFLKLFPEDK
ncbi:hypothetical protein ES703_60390 [subsurface metagenome]